MLDKGAICRIQQNPEEGFFSLVPKKDGKFRPVVNLRPLNMCILYRHFKMEGIYIVRDLLRRGDYMTRIDLKDAYFTVPVHFCKFCYRPRPEFGAAKRFGGAVLSYKHAKDMLIEPEPSEVVLHDIVFLYNRYIITLICTILLNIMIYIDKIVEKIT